MELSNAMGECASSDGRSCQKDENMPLYEYTCQVCTCAFERLRSISQMDDTALCPDCGSESQRQLSVFASFSTGADGQTSAIAGGGGCCGGGGGGACACAMSA